MADLRKNGWSDESLNCQHDLDQKFYLTLAGKSRFWYQIAPGAFGPCFMSILVLQPSSLSLWCTVMVVWLFLAVPWVCLRFVIVVFSGHTHILFFYKTWSLIWIQTVRACIQ